MWVAHLFAVNDLGEPGAGHIANMIAATSTLKILNLRCTHLAICSRAAHILLQPTVLGWEEWSD